MNVTEDEYAQRQDRLEQIQQRDTNHAHAYEMGWSVPDALHDYVADVPWLLEEIERLERELQDLRGWDEDQKEMQQISREWAEYDRDPPGS